MANTSMVKRRNVLDIIKLIEFNNGITKPEIARQVMITTATVNNLIRELITRGLIIEEGYSDSRGGRHATIYKINPTAFFVVGVHISIKLIEAYIFNAKQEIVCKVSESFMLSSNSVENGIRKSLSVTSRAIKKAGISLEKIIGIGIAVPGPVDFDNGIVYELPNANRWQNVMLREIYENYYHVPTIIDKDNHACLLYISWKNNNSDDRNMVFLNMGEGIGTGVMLENKIYRGNRCIAGEIGHISIDLNGEECNCGNRGCMELKASEIALVGQAKRRIKAGDISVITKLAGNNEIIIKHLVTAAKDYNDSLAIELFNECKLYIQLCLEHIIKIYAPNKIIIDCAWLSAMKNIFYDIVDELFESIKKFITRGDMKITLNKVDDLEVKGASALVFDYIFNNYDKSPLLIV